MAMGGVGEAMLFSAAMGGGTAALTGGDPLKGALLGGLTGGLGAGISGALGSAGTTAATTAGNAATTAGNAATTAGNAATTAGTVANTAGNVVNTGLGTQTAFTTGAQSAAPTFSASAPYALPTGATGGYGYLPLKTDAATAANSANIANAARETTQAAYNLGIDPKVAARVTPAGSAPGAESSGIDSLKNFFKTSGKGPSLYDEPYEYLKEHKMPAIGAALAGSTARKDFEKEEYDGPLKRFKYNPDFYVPAFADGGIANLAAGGYDIQVGEDPYPINMASGGISNLGGYSDGGRMLKGPGDGMSDSIPASISGKRPARLADGEFVIPADVVSHLGNGSTDAGAKQLYAMMNKVRKARTGSKSQGREINPGRYMPA
jgi:hypothetical protein